MTTVSFRPLARRDAAILIRWFQQPHVARWWRDGSTSVEAFEDHYGPAIDGQEDRVGVFLILADGNPVGLIQHSPFDGAMPDGYQGSLPIEIDYLVGEPSSLKQGIGSTAIRLFTADLFARDLDLNAVIAMPSPLNMPSRRTLEKSGFRRSATYGTDKNPREEVAFVITRAEWNRR